MNREVIEGRKLNQTVLRTQDVKKWEERSDYYVFFLYKLYIFLFIYTHTHTLFKLVFLRDDGWLVGLIDVIIFVLSQACILKVIELERF